MYQVPTIELKNRVPPRILRIIEYVEEPSMSGVGIKNNDTINLTTRSALF